jgi:hypothetical protein
METGGDKEHCGGGTSWNHPVCRPINRWDNNKMNIMEVGCDDV